jgi:hypothetical protein
LKKKIVGGEGKVEGSGDVVLIVVIELIDLHGEHQEQVTKQ